LKVENSGCSSFGSNQVSSKHVTWGFGTMLLIKDININSLIPHTACLIKDNIVPNTHVTCLLETWLLPKDEHPLFSTFNTLMSLIRQAVCGIKELILLSLIRQAVCGIKELILLSLIRQAVELKN
jgi:hypothetical protein